MKMLKTREQIINILKGGRMASVTFIKADGSVRVLNGQFGNKSLSGAGNGHAPNNSDTRHNTITMAEYGAGSGGGRWRRFRVDRVISVKANGETYGGCRFHEATNESKGK